tara:strand:+ start:18426 stop:18554 length:129 start_codon:yes stop_codon:yes gene_type:complete
MTQPKKEKIQVVFYGFPKKKQEELKKKIFNAIVKKTGVKNVH